MQIIVSVVSTVDFNIEFLSGLHNPVCTCVISDYSIVACSSIVMTWC